eukprot:TRINITY_DN3087_c0_g1_i1.p1 TRINITY_DN3087_c0_g1~~TRINITY_DN3087_c0_g1_i1.p1  ORF type:complete len:420 (+),score=141.89 TRINITY_DN3087_c0_g1_i1:85-1344(+)
MKNIFSKKNNFNSLSKKMNGQINNKIFKNNKFNKIYFLNQQRFVSNTFINFVPEQQAFVIERMGKFSKVCEPGLNILIPFIDKIAYVQSLKIETILITEQSGITKDNVKINVDGVIFYRVEDPKMASYAVDDHRSGIKQLAMSTMRVEIGKLTLEETFQQRNIINSNIVEAINGLTRDWGVRCLRYEMRDLIPPEKIVNAMELQASAERRKRQSIIESEGERQVEINIAEGKRRAILLQAKATAESIQIISKTLSAPGGENAISLRLAEQYIEVFNKLAQKSTTMIMPSDTADVSKIIAQSFGIWKNLSKNTQVVNENFEEAVYSDDESHQVKPEEKQPIIPNVSSFVPPNIEDFRQRQNQENDNNSYDRDRNNSYDRDRNNSYDRDRDLDEEENFNERKQQTNQKPRTFFEEMQQRGN